MLKVFWGRDGGRGGRRETLKPQDLTFCHMLTQSSRKNEAYFTMERPPLRAKATRHGGWHMLEMPLLGRLRQELKVNLSYIVRPHLKIKITPKSWGLRR